MRPGLTEGFIVQSAHTENRQYTAPPALLAFCLVSDYVGFGRSRIYQLIADGEFPPPIKIGKSSRWVRTEIDAWLNRQVEVRNSMSVG